MSTHDDDLVTELRTAMHAEVADVTPSPTLLAGVRKRHARRVATRRLGVAVPAAAVAAVLAVQMVGATGSPAPPQAVNAAYVVQETAKAVDRMSHHVLHERTAEGGTVKDLWIRVNGQAERFLTTVDGKPREDESVSGHRAVTVYYDRHAWRDDGVGLIEGPAENGFTPTRLREFLASGDARVVGPGGVIDGKPTIKLHRDQYVDPTDRFTVPATTFWVDAKTYVPVRVQEDGAKQPTDLDWLAPTKANLALLETKIPAGFKQLPTS